MSQTNEREENRRAHEASALPSVIEVAADLLCHGAGEVLAAACDTAQTGGEAFCAVASSAGHGASIVGHVAAAALESAGDGLG